MPENINQRISVLANDPLVIVTGRIRAFLDNPELKTLPPSCMLRVWGKHLALELKAISYYIRKGAGVKIHFDEDSPITQEPQKVDWFYYVDPSHSDLKYQTEAQRARYIDYNYQINSNQVSLTVHDDMDSIENSWELFIELVASGKTVILDLSSLRSVGQNTTTKIITTGIFGTGETDTGFVDVYYWIAEYLRDPCISTLLKLLGGLCKVIARGGTRKGGILTTAMNYKNPEKYNYLNSPLSEILGGSKKGFRFDSDILKDSELCNLLIEKVNTESVMLEKIIPGKEHLRLNVCMGIYLEDKGSCLIAHANAAQCRNISDLVEAKVKATEFICLIHSTWRENKNADPKLYRPLNEDRQVAVGWLGFANFLAYHGVSYAEHLKALRAYRLGLRYICDSLEQQKAWEIAFYLNKAYKESSKVGLKYDLQRVFTVEPNQRCYRDYKDLNGFTTCRNIDPPFSQTQSRDSAIYGDELLDHGNVETVVDIVDIHKEHWEEFQYLIDSTGLGHALSFDLYEDIDFNWLKRFILFSNLHSTYYQMSDKVQQHYLNSQLLTACDDEEFCSVCAT